MDRAEASHIENYNIGGRRKTIPGETEQVHSCEIFAFPADFAK